MNKEGKDSASSSGSHDGNERETTSLIGVSDRAVRHPEVSGTSRGYEAVRAASY